MRGLLVRGKLQPLDVPWMVSPSVPELHASVVENGHGSVELVAVTLPPSGDRGSGLPSRGVRLTFEHGQWLRTYPAASDTHPLPVGVFDSSRVPFTDDSISDIDGWLERFDAEWARTGRCPDPGAYEVLDSPWLAETGARRFGCKHFVIVGHDLWVELLALRVTWSWRDVSTIAMDLP